MKIYNNILRLFAEVPKEKTTTTLEKQKTRLQKRKKLYTIF